MGDGTHRKLQVQTKLSLQHLECQVRQNTPSLALQEYAKFCLGHLECLVRQTISNLALQVRAKLSLGHREWHMRRNASNLKLQRCAKMCVSVECYGRRNKSGLALVLPRMIIILDCGRSGDQIRVLVSSSSNLPFPLSYSQVKKTNGNASYLNFHLKLKSHL